MFNFDTFLKIGKTHRQCEDYIVSGNDPIPYIILSDGCSTAENTEMGSRILCHLAKKYLQYRASEIQHISYSEMGSWVINNAETVARMLGLKTSSLTATLIIAYMYDEKVHIYTYGDGATIVEFKDGTIEIIKTEFTNNAPYYLVYRIDSFKNMEYYKVKKDLIISSFGTSYKEENKLNTLPYNYQNHDYFKVHEVRSVSICSDGLFSFIKENNMKQEKIPATYFIDELLDFKVTKGEFLKRRLNNAMKSLKKDQIIHFDDFSMGTFLFE